MEGIEVISAATAKSRTTVARLNQREEAIAQVFAAIHSAVQEGDFGCNVSPHWIEQQDVRAYFLNLGYTLEFDYEHDSNYYVSWANS